MLAGQFVRLEMKWNCLASCSQVSRYLTILRFRPENKLISNWVKELSNKLLI